MITEHRGLKRIAARLGWKSPGSVSYAIVNMGFPAYRRQFKHKAVWCVTDELIIRWQLERARIDRRALIEKGAYGSAKHRDQLLAEMDAERPAVPNERSTSAA